MSTDAYTFASIPGEPGGPILFTFHGTGGDEHQLVSLGHELLPGAAIISPRGDVSEYGAARFFRRTGEGVYDMDDLARATAKMARFVKEQAGDRRPVLGLGYSNGANILASTIFAQPDLFDAAVLMHPLIPFAPEIAGSLSGKRLLITAGRRDPICPPDMTSRLEAYLRDTGADITVAWHDGGHEVRPEEIEAARRLLRSLARRTVEDTANVALPEITVEEKGSKGRYVIRNAEGAEAEMTFTRIGDQQIIIDHTEVPDAFRGQGAGLRLVTRAVEDARAQNKKIIPLCPFANAQFRRHPEWADVLKR